MDHDAATPAVPHDLTSEIWRQCDGHVSTDATVWGGLSLLAALEQARAAHT